MDVVIIPRDARLNRHENALVVTSDSGRKSIPLNGVKHVLCMGDGSISIRLLKDMGATREYASRFSMDAAAFSVPLSQKTKRHLEEYASVRLHCS